MKEITIKIPDKKLNFFMELFKQLGLEITETTEIPQWQKEEVLKRIAYSKANPERLLSWENVKNELKIDS